MWKKEKIMVTKELILYQTTIWQRVNPTPYNDDFEQSLERYQLKTLWEKEKMRISTFYPNFKLFANALKFYESSFFVTWKRVRSFTIK